MEDSMPDTAELDLDTAVDDSLSPLDDVQPETEGESLAPETEAGESPETEPLDESDPRVAAILEAKIKDAEARISESYRRRAEHSQRQQRIAAYEEARQQAEAYRATSAFEQIAATVKKAVEDGDEPDFETIKKVVAATNAGGVIEVLEGMEAWTNSFLRSTAPKFFASIPDDDPLNIEWSEAKIKRNPAELFKVAQKAAYAAGEQAGREAGKADAEKEIKARQAARQKTEQIRTADATRSTQGRPTQNLTNGVPKRLTLQEIDAMPMAEWMRIPREEQSRLLELARRG
jgi:Tfp pilus assembly protein PilN